MQTIAMPSVPDGVEFTQGTFTNAKGLRLATFCYQQGCSTPRAIVFLLHGYGSDPIVANASRVWRARCLTELARPAALTRSLSGCTPRHQESRTQSSRARSSTAACEQAWLFTPWTTIRQATTHGTACASLMHDAPAQAQLTRPAALHSSTGAPKMPGACAHTLKNSPTWPRRPRTTSTRCSRVGLGARARARVR